MLYEALTIMSLMGHKDWKRTMRYIRTVQLQRDVRPIQPVHKLTRNEIPPASDGSGKLLDLWVGARGIRTSDLSQVVIFDEGFDVSEVLKIHMIVGIDLFALERIH